LGVRQHDYWYDWSASYTQS